LLLSSPETEELGGGEWKKRITLHAFSCVFYRSDFAGCDLLSMPGQGRVWGFHGKILINKVNAPFHRLKTGGLKGPSLPEFCSHIYCSFSLGLLKGQLQGSL
jgi:hypothetical protein